jgi:uncharacterized membrane protein YdjX (TVP38/TMEM64 family)
VSAAAAPALGGADEPGPRARRVALLRLGALLLVLCAAFAAFWLLDLVDRGDVRALVEPFGAFGPAAYVVVSSLLGAALVTSIVSLLLARRAAGGAVKTVSGPRTEALTELATRHGTFAVVVQRLLPVVPDAPASYLFGVLGISVRQIALGTAIGAAPRAFSYTSIGASLDDPGSPLAIAGIAGVVITGLAGAVVGGRLLRRSPRASRARRWPRRSDAARGRTPPSAG